MMNLQKQLIELLVILKLFKAKNFVVKYIISKEILFRNECDTCASGGHTEHLAYLLFRALIFIATQFSTCRYMRSEFITPLKNR